MGLALVRSLGLPRRFTSAQDAEDFEQELVDQFLLAGMGDGSIAQERALIFEFSRFLARPLWTAQAQDADKFLVSQRKARYARTTVQRKAWMLANFYEFLTVRYQGDIHALTGHVVVQPIDEFNRPAKAGYESVRVPPATPEVVSLFSLWRDALPQARKYLPAARDYFAASLWRRVGLRIGETVCLDLRDWRTDLGDRGKLHVRYGKGSRGKGPKARFGAGYQRRRSVDGLVAWRCAAPVR